MKLKFIGGASTVTGSCYYMEINKLRILVECGMHQGEDTDGLDERDLPFKAKDIDFVFVTHAHIDHSGMLPRLVREGFKGRVISTPATHDLLDPMLKDSANIQLSDAEWETRKNLRAGRPPVEPLYTADDVDRLLMLFDVRPYGKLFHLGGGVKYRLFDAGHILGSATLELFFQDSDREKVIVFSGDIGKEGNPIMKDPLTPEEADYVVMESTYGDRSHRPFKETITELVDAIKDTLRRGGNVYIPSFAVGRTQDLLYILNNLVREGRLNKLDVYLDSPLAEKITKIYLAHPECYDEEAKKLFTTDSSETSIRLHFTKSAEESMKLNKIKGGSIIIAGSGMCEGGRMRHHLKHNLWRAECSVIFVGFQARGTLGRLIVDGAKVVKILGETVAVRAKIHTINGFSAHAGRDGLIKWLGGFSNSPQVFLVHGEDEAREALEGLIAKEYGFKTHRPNDGDEVEL